MLLWDSERSDKCIDFKIIMCVCIRDKYSQNNVSIFHFSIFSGGKVNFWGFEEFCQHLNLKYL